MLIKVTFPDGSSLTDTSYPSVDALIAGMFQNGKKPDGVKVEGEGEEKPKAKKSKE